MTGWAIGDRMAPRSPGRKPEANFVNRKILQRVYGTTDPGVLSGFIARIAANSVRVHPEQSARLVFIDSYDWRLYRRGWVLVQDGKVYHLCDRKSGLELAWQDCTGTAPRFARDLPQGELRDYLAKALSVRALLHLVTVVGSVRCDQYTDPKTRRVWHVAIASLRLKKKGQELPFLHTVNIQPADGRDSGGKRLVRLVKKSGLNPLPPTLLEPALRRAGLRPASYSSRLRVPLDPDQSAGEAVVQIATHLQTTLKANLKGIVLDIDSEFLHDFRVASRRTRCLLSISKKVTPKKLRRAFCPLFSELGKMTGPIRDLDVYQLYGDRYRNLVPEHLRPGLAEISTRSVQLRSLHRDKLVRYLADPAFRSSLAEWDKTLASGPASWKKPSKAAKRPIGMLADQKVATSYNRLIKQCLAIDSHPRDRDLHRLRLACKDHRYALEFFASLYPKAAVTSLLSPLKQVQDLLGEHSDLSTHSDHLQRLLAAEADAALTPVGAAAAEALIVQLDEAKADLRDRFAGLVSVLAGAKTRKLVAKMTCS